MSKASLVGSLTIPSSTHTDFNTVKVYFEGDFYLVSTYLGEFNRAMGCGIKFNQNTSIVDLYGSIPSKVYNEIAFIAVNFINNQVDMKETHFTRNSEPVFMHTYAKSVAFSFFCEHEGEAHREFDFYEEAENFLFSLDGGNGSLYGYELRAIREMLGISVSEAAKYVANCNVRTWQRWESSLQQIVPIDVTHTMRSMAADYKNELSDVLSSIKSDGYSRDKLNDLYQQTTNDVYHGQTLLETRLSQAVAKNAIVFFNASIN